MAPKAGYTELRDTITKVILLSSAHIFKYIPSNLFLSDSLITQNYSANTQALDLSQKVEK